MSPASTSGAATGPATARPAVLLCECAGTMANVDFDELAMFVGREADVLRGETWCNREGQARLLELLEAGEGGGSSSRAVHRISPIAASTACCNAASP